MLLNLLMILVIVGVVVYAAYHYYKVLRLEEKFEIAENPYTVDYLVQTVNTMFSDMMAADPRDMNLSREELRSRERQRKELMEAFRMAGFGDKESKEYITLRIKDIIRKKEGVRNVLDIDENTINRVIHFDEPERLSDRDMFEILMYVYRKKYGDMGLDKYFKDFELDKPIQNERTGEMMYDVTSERVRSSYFVVMKDYELSYPAKLDILSARIFAQLSKGAAEILFDFPLDEIDCGVSGIPKGSFKIAQIEDMLKEGTDSGTISYSYQSIWIMRSALKIHLSFLGFESQKELVRVCQNIYKYNAMEMISSAKPYIIGTMINGSRIVVTRPSASSSWAFFARKFDSVKNIAPEKLLVDRNKEIAITMVKWIVRGYLSFVVSGGMGTGKSTFLKSQIRFIPAENAIRVYEISPELNLSYTYPERNIMGLSETGSIKLQELLDLGMKLNSDITVIGEMASQESVSYYIQSNRKGSKQAMGTIHTKTVRALVDYMRDSLVGYNNKQAAEEAVVEAVNIDIHLEKEKDHRFVERITQIVPLSDRRYPSQLPENAHLSLEEKALMDDMEYKHRITDRQLYTERDLVVYKDGAYHLVNLPTDDIIARIKNVLTAEEEAQFDRDMLILQKLEEKEGMKVG